MHRPSTLDSFACLRETVGACVAATNSLVVREARHGFSGFDNEVQDGNHRPQPPWLQLGVAVKTWRQYPGSLAACSNAVATGVPGRQECRT